MRLLAQRINNIWSNTGRLTRYGVLGGGVFFVSVVALILVLMFRVPTVWMGGRIQHNTDGYHFVYAGISLSAGGVQFSGVGKDHDGQLVHGIILNNIVVDGKNVSLRANKGLWAKTLGFDRDSLLYLSDVVYHADGVDVIAPEATLRFLPGVGPQGMLLYNANIRSGKTWSVGVKMLTFNWDTGLIRSFGWSHSMVSIDARDVSLNNGWSASDISLSFDTSKSGNWSAGRMVAFGVHMPNIPSFGWHASVVPMSGSIDFARRRIVVGMESSVGVGWIGAQFSVDNFNVQDILDGMARPSYVTGVWNDHGAIRDWLVAHQPNNVSDDAWRNIVGQTIIHTSWLSNVVLSQAAIDAALLGNQSILWMLAPTDIENITQLWSNFWSPLRPASGEFWVGPKEKLPNPWRMIP